MSTKKLIIKQPFYKQPIKNPHVKKLRNFELLCELPIYDDINTLRKKKGHLKGMQKPIKQKLVTIIKV